MKFEWDEKKSKTNLEKHKISFEDAATVFNDPFHLSILDGAHSKSEERWITIGNIFPGIATVIVAHTYKDENDVEIIRLISARKATAKEKRQYMHRRG
jgi:uncharacterized DUF497 family protein